MCYNAREVRYFCVKMVKNNEKNEQNMCRIYIKCIESMCILYKKLYKKYSKKHAKREINTTLLCKINNIQ